MKYVAKTHSNAGPDTRPLKQRVSWMAVCLGLALFGAVALFFGPPLIAILTQQ